MQNSTINAEFCIICIFVKNLFYAGFSTKSELCIASEDDSLSSFHGSHFYLGTKFRNIKKHLETQFEHSMFNSN